MLLRLASLAHLKLQSSQAQASGHLGHLNQEVTHCHRHRCWSLQHGSPPRKGIVLFNRRQKFPVVSTVIPRCVAPLSTKDFAVVRVCSGTCSVSTHQVFRETELL